MSSTQPPTESGASPEKPEKKTAKGRAAAAPRRKSAKAAKAAQAPPPTRADEIIEALKAASRDKEIDFERLVAALEEAIATAARKVYKVREMGARFDQKTGTLTAWTPYRLVAEKTVKPEDVAAAAAAAAAALDPDDVPLGQSAAPAPAPAAPVDPDKEIRLPYIEVLPEEAPALLEGELLGQSWQIVRNPRGEDIDRRGVDHRGRRDAARRRDPPLSARPRASGASPPRAPSRSSTRRSARPSATTSTTSTSRSSASSSRARSSASSGAT